MAKSPVPIHRYTITLTDGTERTADAFTIREHEEWLLFDDTRATVFQIRREKVDEIARSTEPVGHQDVEDGTTGGQHA